MRASLVTTCLVVALTGLGTTSASADPARTARANAYAVDLDSSLLGNLIEREPEVTSVLPPGGLESEDIVTIDASPVVLTATGVVEAETSVESTIEPTLASEGGAGDGDGEISIPLVNARGFSRIENLAVLIEEDGDDLGLDEAEQRLVTEALASLQVLEAEAVAVCGANGVSFDTASRIVSLNGEEVTALDDIFQTVEDELGDIFRVNEVGTTEGGGIFVNALRIVIGADAVDTGAVDTEGDPLANLDSTDTGVAGTGAPGLATPNVSSASDLGTADALATEEMFEIQQAEPDEEPLLDLVLSHAEVARPTCGAPDGPDDPDDPDGDLAECSDTRDNDGDGLVDFPADPGCESAQDNDERDGQNTQQPPGGGPAIQQPAGGVLPITGGESLPLVGLGVLGLAGALLGLRRRLST